MDDNIGRFWEPTSELRWLHPHAGTIVTSERTLQQKWRCRNTGDEQWREPTIAIAEDTP